MKEKLQKLLNDKRAQETNLRAALIDGESKEERAAIGETLQALAAEIAEIESVLAEMDEPAADQQAAAAGERKVLGVQTMETRNVNDTEKEYRAAWLRNLQGNVLTEEEKRAMTSAAGSAGAVVPVYTQNKIITKVKELCPMLDYVQLLHVAGSVKFAVEGVVNAADQHAENADITSAADTLVEVELAGYEIVKLVRISATVKTMSIDAFEDWLTAQLARMVGEVIENRLINGTGVGQSQGIAKAAAWADGTNAVKWAAEKPTAEEITKQISLLPSRHARNAKFVMSRKTFWQSVMPLRDDKKMPIVAGEGAGVYNIFGYGVLLSDYVADGEIYFGNLEMVVANLAQDITVESSAASGFAKNAIDYRGVAIFDCKVADAEAFVKAAVSVA